MPRRAGPGLDRSAVIQAAEELVDVIGVDQLTLSQLAEHLGIRTPSLYNHVAGLPGLRRELAMRCTQELLARLQWATIGKAGEEAIVALGQAFREYAREHSGRYACTHQPADPSDHELQDVQQRVVDLVLVLLKPYGLSGDDALHVVRGLRSAIYGFISLELMGGFGLPLDLNESFRRLLKTLTDGLQRSSITHPKNQARLD